MRKRWLILGACGVAIIGVAVVVILLTTTHTAKHGNAPRTGKPHGAPAQPAEDKLACTEKLPDAVQIGQKLMFAGYSDQLASSTAALAQANIGGVIIMNETPQTAIAAFRGAFSIAPTIAVDQEGGTVQRYTSEGTLPGATTMASSFSPGQAYQQYLNDEKFLKTVGFTTNLAPVLDVTSHTPSSLPGRMYSSDPSVISQYASSAIRAAEAAGITPVVKHFPGLGSTATNTDFGSATTDPLAVLKTRDLVPYQQVSQLHPDAMVSNAIVPDLTDGQPAVWSAAAVTLLRSYGYQNAVVYTDSLTANAVPGSLDSAALKAWQAGTDVALIVQTHENTGNVPAYIQAITSSAAAALQSGQLDRHTFAASVLRILNRKGVDPCSIAPAAHQ